MAAAFSFRDMSEEEFKRALRLREHFDFTPAELRNKQVVLAIINGKRKGEILADLPADLKDDEDIVRAAISTPQGGMNLRYASERLKRYGEFIRLAIEYSNAEYLCHLVQSQPDLVDKRLIMRSIPIDPILIARCIPQNLQDDRDILEALIDACLQVEDPEQDDDEEQERDREDIITEITDIYKDSYGKSEEFIDSVISRASRKRPRIDLTEEGGRRSTFRHRRSRNTRGMKKSKRKRRKSRRKSKRSV